MTTREIQSRLNQLKKDLKDSYDDDYYVKSLMRKIFGFGLFLCDSEKKMQSVCERIVPLMKETFPTKRKTFTRLFNELAKEVMDYQKDYAKRAKIQNTALATMKEMKGATIEEKLNALPTGVLIHAYIRNVLWVLIKEDTKDKNCWLNLCSYKSFYGAWEIQAFSIDPAYNGYISDCEQTPWKQAVRYMKADNESYHCGYYYGELGRLTFDEKCEWINKNRWNLHENY